MYKIIDKNIYLNRGDQISIIVANNSDAFELNDVITIHVCEQGDYSRVVLSKQGEIDQNNPNQAKIELTSEETKLGEPLKSTEKVYWYEIELNGNKTLVGYDNNGPKLFTLWPEAIEGGN